MDPVSFTEMLKQFGPYGICLFLMGSGLVYLMRWLREALSQFMVALKSQRDDYTASLKQVTADMKEGMKEQSMRIDGLSGKVDELDNHVRELRKA